MLDNKPKPIYPIRIEWSRESVKHDFKALQNGLVMDKQGEIYGIIEMDDYRVVLVPYNYLETTQH